jgi:hypothetical protein
MTTGRIAMEFLAVSLLVSTEDSQQTCVVKDVARTTQSDLRIFMVESRIKDMSDTIDDLGRSTRNGISDQPHAFFLLDHLPTPHREPFDSESSSPVPLTSEGSSWRHGGNANSDNQSNGIAMAPAIIVTYLLNCFSYEVDERL